MAIITVPPTTKGWAVDGLVQLGPRMQPFPRVSAVRDGELLGEIIKNYEASGTPLIIEDWNETPYWPGDSRFGIDWVLKHGDEMIAVRDCVSLKDKEISLKEFIEKSRTISEYAEEGGGKDYMQWHEWLIDSAIPELLKPGSSEDVLELLPEPERVETLMYYYGIGDTFTAAHKDLCASSGQNLMCSAERGGSAFWFMTRSSDAAKAATYFQRLGSELDHEEHVATTIEFSTSSAVSEPGRRTQSYARTSGVGQIQPAGQAQRRFILPSASNSSVQSGGTSNGIVPSTSGGVQRRFVPLTPSMGNGRRFVPSSSSGTAQGYAQAGNIGNGTDQPSTSDPSR